MLALTLGKAPALITNITRKSLAETNTSLFWSDTNEKCVIGSTLVHFQSHYHLEKKNRARFTKLFTAVISSIRRNLECLSLSVIFTTAAIVTCKSRSLALKWSLVKGSTVVDSSLAYKYEIRLIVMDSDKQCSFVQ